MHSKGEEYAATLLMRVTELDRYKALEAQLVTTVDKAGVLKEAVWREREENLALHFEAEKLRKEGKAVGRLCGSLRSERVSGAMLTVVHVTRGLSAGNRAMMHFTSRNARSTRFRGVMCEWPCQ